MILSLRTTSYTTAIFVAIVLGFLLLLGSRQYQSHQHYDRIIEQNEKIVFQFSTIREHIAESLLEEQYKKLTDIIREVEDLNTNISQMLQEPYIPDQYRMSFAGQVDLAGLILLLRGVAAGETDQAKLRQLSQEVRILGDRLMLFDRLIVNHVKRKLLGFQSMIIGILAIVVFIIIYVLLFWHRQTAIPLLGLLKQMQDVDTGRRHDIAPLKETGEVAELGRLIQNQLSNQKTIVAKVADRNNLTDTADKLTEAVWQAGTRDDIYSEACKALLTNGFYCLTWVGRAREDNQIVPVIQDGSTTMNRQECEECMTNLRATTAERGRDFDAALQAQEQLRPILQENILANQPRGPYKNSPFTSGYANWLAVPIQYGTECYGILNIYSTFRESFSKEEIQRLLAMADEMAHAISSLEAGKTWRQLQDINQQLVATIDIMMIRLTPEGAIISANRKAEQVLGLELRDFTGRDWLSFLSVEARPAHEQIMKSLRAESSSAIVQREINLVDSAKNTIATCCSYAPMRDENGCLREISWVGVDLSDQRWTSRNMAKMQGILQAVFQETPDLVILFSEDGTIIEANPAALAETAMDHDSMLGGNIIRILFRNDPPQAAFLEALTTASSTDFECSFSALNGQHSVRIMPLVFEKDGMEDCRLMIARNITLEKQLLNDTVKAARLAAMGELAIDTAHEINNISNVLINYTQILLEEIGGTGDTQYQKELLGNIINEGERIAQIVHQILIFSANRSQIVESVSIEKIVGDSLALIRHQLQHDGIETKTEFPKELPLVPINVQKMQHVFLNLLLNARDALNLRYAHRDVNKRLEIRGETSAGSGQRRLKIYFTDWGIGIHPKIASKIFDPFFTTKPLGSGTGLGLCISKGLVQEHKGDIHIDSMPDSYTTVTVDLPLVS